MNWRLISWEWLRKKDLRGALVNDIKTLSHRCGTDMKQANRVQTVTGEVQKHV